MAAIEYFKNAIIFSLVLSATITVRGLAARQLLDCVDSDTGKLQDGMFVENGACVKESVWFYELSRPVIASNGLQQGSPTHFQLYFGSIGNPLEDAFDPQNPGLGVYAEEDFFEMKLELSPHFLYNQYGPNASLPAQPLFTTELAIAPANILYPEPCLLEKDSPRGKIFCSGWDSQLGSHPNEIIIFADIGLYGQRALDVGIKFFHLHPVLNTNQPIYWNANGTCSESSNDETEYCRLDTDCSVESATCLKATEPLTASVTATVFRKDGSVLHKGIRSYDLDEGPRYHVAASNTAIACVTSVFESVDFQRTKPFAVANRFERICEVSGSLEEPLFSEGVPYAPRFYLFGPNGDIAFPGATIEDLRLTKSSSTFGEIYIGDTLLGNFKLIQPEGANATILEEDLGWYTANSRFQGALFGIPIQLGGTPGKYIVEVKLLEGGETQGAMARSTTIVEEEENSSCTWPQLSFLLFGLLLSGSIYALTW